MPVFASVIAATSGEDVSTIRVSEVDVDLDMGGTTGGRGGVSDGTRVWSRR